MTEDFTQPTLDDPNAPAGGTLTALPERVATGTAIVNTGKTDELSVALAQSKIPVAALPEPVKPPGKYTLDYSLKGEAIHETYVTVPQALARIAELGRLNIVPATGTVD